MKAHGYRKSHSLNHRDTIIVNTVEPHVTTNLFNNFTTSYCPYYQEHFFVAQTKTQLQSNPFDMDIKRTGMSVQHSGGVLITKPE